MAEEDSFGGGDPEAESGLMTSASPSPSSSPKISKEKIKLRCSHGGKIMVRPPAGRLKYVGGETRVVAIPRRITFSELMKKLNDLVDGGEIVLKYQLVPEELDTLVTVRSDEDLKHMLEEYDRQEHESGTPRIRAFLFPSKPVVVESGSSMSSHALEQRYIDAINGIVRATPPPLHLRTAPSSARPSFSISSPCSSPKVISPEKVLNPWDASNLPSPKRKLSSMHKVRSSPTLFSDGGEGNQQIGSSSQFGRQLGMYQGYRHQKQIYGHHYHQHRGGGLYSVNSLQPQDFYRGVGRLEHGRGGLLFGHGAMDRYYPAGGRPYKGNRGLLDEGSNTIDRSDSIPHTHREVMWE